MRLQGNLRLEHDNGKPYYLAEVPELLIATDGETKEEALNMAQDAIGLLLEDHTNEKITAKDILIIPTEHGFDVSCADTTALVSLVLKQMRGKSDMTLQNITNKIGQKYVNAVRQYEAGQVEASFSKFQDLVFAMGYDVKLSLIKIA